MPKPAPPAPSLVLAMLVMLRLVIALSVTCSIFYILDVPGILFIGPTQPALNISASLVTVVHHVGTASGPKYFPLPVWADTLLTLVEVALHWYMAAFPVQYIRSWIAQGAGSTYGLPAFAAFAISLRWVLALCLTIYLTLKVVRLIATPKRNWKDRVDVGSYGEPWLRHLASTVFSRRLWTRSVPGEAAWLVFVRGTSTLLVIAVIITFGIFQLILAPVWENGRTPRGEYGTTELEGSQRENYAWNISSVMMFERDGRPGQDFSNALSVSWTFEDARSDLVFALRTLPSVLGRCEGTLADYIGQCFQARPDWDTAPSLKRWFNGPPLRAIHIQVNYTTLSLPPLDEVTIYDAVQVYVGAGANFDPKITAARPIHLFSGTHLLSVGDPTIRRRIKSTKLAALGFESYEDTMILNPISVIANPNASSTDPRIATASIIPVIVNRKGEWVVLQDFRSKSVLVGLSAVGGLGSFLSTLLLVLVGTSLMTAVVREFFTVLLLAYHWTLRPVYITGSRPYSPFGILHIGMNRAIAHASRDRYPELDADIRQAQGRPGVVAFLFDTMIDIEPLGYRDTPERGVGLHPEGDGDISSGDRGWCREMGILDSWRKGGARGHGRNPR
ncbi:hypothetical protein NMY22_g19916 [Coprinellus aureogranulatus]|nr:hypothetical protein NMY22_g19916 [Coprinellus aureogranulatus]